MPTTDQIQSEINGLEASLQGQINVFNSKFATLFAQLVNLQQRCYRLEAQVADLQRQLARVRKG